MVGNDGDNGICGLVQEAIVNKSNLKIVYNKGSFNIYKYLLSDAKKSAQQIDSSNIDTKTIMNIMGSLSENMYDIITQFHEVELNEVQNLIKNISHSFVGWKKYPQKIYALLDSPLLSDKNDISNRSVVNLRSTFYELEHLQNTTLTDAKTKETLFNLFNDVLMGVYLTSMSLYSPEMDNFLEIGFLNDDSTEYLEYTKELEQLVKDFN